MVSHEDEICIIFFTLIFRSLKPLNHHNINGLSEKGCLIKMLQAYDAAHSIH